MAIFHDTRDLRIRVRTIIVWTHGYGLVPMVPGEPNASAGRRHPGAGRPRRRRVQKHERTQDRRAGTFRIRGVYAWFAIGSWDYSVWQKQLGRPRVRDFLQKGGYFLPRPDGSRLHHPPTSLGNCGTAETVRFSARLAGFFKIRCHQRRAIRPEQASFSVLVSNFDFRVPRLRQIGERALTGPCGSREKRPPERLRIEAGATAA